MLCWILVKILYINLIIIYIYLYKLYSVAKAATCMPIPDEVSFDTASSSFVNPLTVIAMLDIT